jgi:hypothetical protein
MDCCGRKSLFGTGLIKNNHPALAVWVTSTSQHQHRQEKEIILLIMRFAGPSNLSNPQRNSGNDQK